MARTATHALHGRDPVIGGHGVEIAASRQPLEQLNRDAAVQTQDELRGVDVCERAVELTGERFAVAGRPAADELTPFERILVKNLAALLIEDEDIQRAAGLVPQSPVVGERKGA